MHESMWTCISEMDFCACFKAERIFAGSFDFSASAIIFIVSLIMALLPWQCASHFFIMSFMDMPEDCGGGFGVVGCWPVKKRPAEKKMTAAAIRGRTNLYPSAFRIALRRAQRKCQACNRMAVSRV